MKARVNTRFVFILGAVIVVLTVGLALAWHLLMRVDPTQLIARGDAFVQRNEPAKAAQAYSLALRARPSDVNLILKYTRALADTPIDDAAVARQYITQLQEMWTRASTFDPDRAEPIDQLMGVYLTMARDLGDTAAWDAMAQRSSAVLRDRPNHLTARKYRGIAQVNRMAHLDLSAEDRQLARQDLEAALAQFPDDLEATLALAQWLARQAHAVPDGAGQADRVQSLREQARALTAAAIERHADDPRRALDHLRILMETGDREQAVAVAQSLEKRLLTQPRPVEVVTQFAELLPQALTGSVEPAPPGFQEWGRVEALLRSAAAAHPQDVRVHFALGQTLRLRQQVEAAGEVFDRVRRMPIHSTPVDALRAAQLQITAGYQHTDLLLTRAQQMEPSPQREALLAEAQRSIRQLTGAGSASAPGDSAATASAGASGAVNLLAGKLAYTRGQWGEAAIRLDRACAQLSDSNPEGLFLAARAQRRLGELGAAVDRLERLLKIRPNLQPARLELAQLLVETRQPTRALEQLQIVLSASPQDATTRALQAQAFADAGDPGHAIAVLESLLRTDAAQAALPLARLHLAAGRKQRALDLLVPAFKSEPKNLALLQELIRISEDADAGEYLETARQAGADERALALIWQQARGQADTHESVLALLEAEPDAVRRHLGKAQLLRQLGRTADAQAQLDAAAKLAPNDPRVIDARFEAALLARDFPSAQTLAERAAGANLDFSEGLTYFGRLDLARSQPDRALASFRRALTLRPVNSEAWRLLGECQQQMGDPVAAVASFEQSLRDRPDNVAARRGLASAYDTQGQRDKALAQLRLAIEFPAGQRLLMPTYLDYEERFGDARRALALRRGLLAQQPDDLVNRRQIALLLARAGEAEPARRAADELLANFGATPANLEAAAQVRIMTGDARGARALLEDHIARRGRDATADDVLPLARMFARHHQPDLAVAAYRRAIALEDKKNRLASRELADLYFSSNKNAQALTLYRALWEDSGGDTRVGRRVVETLVRLQQLDQAEVVLKQIAGKDDNPLANLLLSALIARWRGQGAQAITILDQALELAPRAAIVYYQRAELNAGQPGKETAAMGDLQRALELDPGLLQARQLLADIRARRGERDQAIRELRALLERQPEDSTVRMQLARMLQQANQPMALQALLEESAKVMPGESAWPRLAGYAAIQSGRLDVAIQKFALALKLEPSTKAIAELMLAQIEARQPAAALQTLSASAKVEGVAASALLEALRARALWSMGQTREAQDAFDAATPRCREFKDAAAVVGQRALAMGTAPTIAWLQDPATPPLAGQPRWNALILAQLQAREGQFAAALRILQDLDTQVPPVPPAAPERIEIDRLLALCLQQQGAFAQARQVYERLLKGNPQDPAVLNNLAYLLAENLNEPAAAVTLAQRAIDLAPSDPQLLDTLGWALFKAGRSDESLETLRRSFQVERLPSNSTHLAQVLAERGQDKEASEMRETARQLIDEQNARPRPQGLSAAETSPF